MGSWRDDSTVGSSAGDHEDQRPALLTVNWHPPYTCSLSVREAGARGRLGLAGTGWV